MPLDQTETAQVSNLDRLEADAFNPKKARDIYEKIDRLVAQRSKLNAQISACKGEIKKLGVPTAVVNETLKIRNMDQKQRSKYDFWLTKMRAACDLPIQTDLESEDAANGEDAESQH